jgi:two-component system NtrC family response regulator
MGIRLLLAEDDASQRRVMEYHLSESGYSVITAEDGRSALEAFRGESPDLVLTDMSMPRMDGMELLREIKRLDPTVPVVIITAFGSIREAVQAIREGAFEYVTKPVDNDELELVVARALEHRELEEENARLRLEVRGRYRFASIIGGSSPIKHLFQLMARVAASDATALILGESGTGKELVARAIHYNSERADGPFVAVNCGAIPRELVEAELFGCRKGAFTGATRDRRGRFELADGGTIFLDEISELPLDLQVKLLRVLDERLVTPVGAEEAVPVDVRVLAASNRMLDGAVADGDFREDLYYRLNVVAISVPPLRKRTEDIPLLVEHFLEKLGQPDCEVRPDVWDALAAHPWPGNVRQLENAIERALVLQAEPGRLSVDDLPPEITAQRAEPALPGGDFPDEGISLEQTERRLIQMALSKADGNQTRAAELLGVTRHTLIYRMQKHGLR